MTASLSSDNPVDHDRGRILQGQTGDGAPVMLTLQKMHPAFAYLSHRSAKQGLFSPLLPVWRQSRVQGTIRPLNLLKAEPVEAGVGKESHQFARRSVRRRHREFLSIHQRELAVCFGRGHLSAPPAHPFTERPHGPVVQPPEHGRTVVGAIMIAEAANDRIGLLNLLPDRENVVAEQLGQGFQVLPNRRATRSHQEFRRRKSLELSPDKVKALRVMHNSCFLRAQPQPPRCEEHSQLGEDDRFELPPRTGQDHESSSPGELHPQALTEPDGNLSAHPALIVQSRGVSRETTARTSSAHGGPRGLTNERLVADGTEIV